MDLHIDLVGVELGASVLRGPPQAWQRVALLYQICNYTEPVAQPFGATAADTTESNGEARPAEIDVGASERGNHRFHRFHRFHGRRPTSEL